MREKRAKTRQTSDKDTRKKKPNAGLDMRLRAAQILREVLNGSTFEPLREKQIAIPQDRAFCNRLITQALRSHFCLRKILDAKLERGLPKRSGILEAALHIGLSELLFMDRDADHAAIHSCVEIVRMDKRSRRFDRLANGVLRQMQRDIADAGEGGLSWPAADFFAPKRVKQIAHQFGAENVENFAVALREGATLDLTIKQDAPAWAERLGGQALNGQTVRVLQRDVPVAALPGFAEGAFFVQDVAAAMPAQMLDVKEGARVLDMCAAPGGKTAQLCLRGFDVVALDVDARRLERVRENLERLQLQAKLEAADATQFADDQGFDGIILDAPCSASGTFRRHPEVLINRDAKDVARLVKVQRALLKAAVDLLKPGGSLIYCVCSLEEKEGQDQLTWALDNLDVDLDRLAGPDFGGVQDAINKQGCLRTHAGLRISSGPENPIEGDKLKVENSGMDGFFAMRLKKCVVQ